MRTSKLKLITIIAEPILVSQIKREIQAIGSSGLTSTDVSGEGSRHLHTGEIPGNKIKIETVVDSTVAEQILEHISRTYFDNYSIVAYVSDVEVLRVEKFSSQK